MIVIEFVEIFKSSMKPKKKERKGMETDYGKPKNKPDPLSPYLKDFIYVTTNERI